MMIYIFRILLLIWLFVGVSCIEGDEEVSLYADGSGHVKAVYRVPGMLLSQQDGESLKESVRRGVQGNGNLELITNTVESVKGYRVITIEVASANVMALKVEEEEAPSKGQSDQLLTAIIGDIAVKLKGLSVELDRGVDLVPLFSERFGEDALSKLGDSEFRYKLHLPKAAKSTNAHEVLNDGKTLKWSYRLADISQEPISLSVTAPVPVPWWIYVSILLVVALVVLIIVLLVRFKRAF